MIHQVSAGFQGTAIDINIQAQEVLRYNRMLNEILAYHTGQPIERVEQDTQRDYFMSAQEAKEYGIIDEILSRGAR
jgi:ATP-dependent Clp protease protease subunit